MRNRPWGWPATTCRCRCFPAPRTPAVKEHQVAVARQRQATVGGGTVEGSNVDRGSPRAIIAIALRNPNVVATESPCAGRGEEETEPVWRERRLNVGDGRVDRTEVHWRRPLGVSEGHRREPQGRRIRRSEPGGQPVGLGATSEQQGEGDQHGHDTSCGFHGTSLPSGARVDIHRSLPPLPPGRLEVKIMVPPSRDRVGCESI